MADSRNESGSIGDEVLKQVGALGHAVSELDEDKKKNSMDSEETKSWISFLIRTVASIFVK